MTVIEYVWVEKQEIDNLIQLQITLPSLHQWFITSLIVFDKVDYTRICLPINLIQHHDNNDLQPYIIKKQKQVEAITK